MMFAAFGLAAWAAANVVSTTPPISGTLDGDLGVPQPVSFQFDATPWDAASGTAGLINFTGFVGDPVTGTHVVAGMTTRSLDTARFQLVDVDDGLAILKDKSVPEAPVYFGVTVTEPTNDQFVCHARRILVANDGVWTPDFTMSLTWDLPEAVGQGDTENIDTVAEYVATEVLAAVLEGAPKSPPGIDCSAIQNDETVDNWFDCFRNSYCVCVVWQGLKLQSMTFAPFPNGSGGSCTTTCGDALNAQP